MITDTSKSMLQPVLDALPGQLAVLDDHGHIAIVNSAWRNALPATTLAIGDVGDDYLLRCEPPIAAGIRDVLNGDDEEFSLNYPVASNGCITWYSVHFRPFNDGPVRGIVVTHDDITLKVDNESACCQNDRTLHSLVDASPLAIIELDTDLLVTRWNPAAERMFGWTEAEVLGTFNPIVPPERRDEFIANLQDALTAEDGISGLHVVRRHKDGTLLNVQISHTGVYSVSGELRGAMAIISDVTERSRVFNQQQFLADASAELSSSLDYERTLARVAELAVPSIADMCAVNLLDEDGRLRRLAVAHYDPARATYAQEFLSDFGVVTDPTWGTAQVIRTGLPDIRQWPKQPDPGESELVGKLRVLGLRSTMTVPLVARNEIIGTISVLYGDSGRTFTEADLPMVQGLASRAAMAIDNARLYQSARKAEMMYRTIVEHVPAITYTAKAEDLSELLYISNQAELESELHDGHGWCSRIHPDDTERVLEAMRACSVSGEPLQVEYRIVQATGELSWRLDRAHLLLGPGGDPLHWQGMVVDITDQKNIEQTLQIRARQQAAVARFGQRAVGDVDLDQMGVDAAAIVSEILGTEFVSVALYEPAQNKLMIRAVVGGTPASDEDKCVSLDLPSLMTYTYGSAAPVIFHDLANETRFVPWQGMVDAGVTSGLSVAIPGPRFPNGVILAVTADKRRFTEDDVNFLQSIGNLVSATLEHARDEEQLRFQAHLLDVISQAVIATDNDGHITYWNQHAEKLYGWRRDEVVGKQIIDVTPSTMTRDQSVELMDTARRGESWAGDTELQRRDGSLFHGFVVLSPLLDNAGRVSGMVGVSADITDRVEAHAERERLLRALGERVKELTALHRAAALFEGDGHSLDLVLCELAEMLPAGLQNPELAAARLEVGEYWATSAGYVPTPWSIRTEFALPGGGSGSIEVNYVVANPHDGAMLFMPEEYSLVDTLADMFCAYLQRIHNREQLQKSEARIRAATDGTLDAFAILVPVRNSQGTVVDYCFDEVNDRAVLLLKHEREQLLGRTLRELFLPQQAAMFVEGFNLVVETGETIEREVEVPRETDGFWMLYQAVPLDDGVAVFASETTEQRRLEDQLIHQAFHDALTGLPNRALFIDRVDHARSRVRLRHEGIAVLFLDLDNFKIVNDSLGHNAGDILLIAVAERLQGCIGDGDTAARFGGDEFAILLEDLADWGSVNDTAEAIIAALSEPFSILGREIYITPSIGVAVATSSDATASDLLRDSDAAMYRAKRNGKARVEIFDPSLITGIVERFEIENDLRRAVERNEFRVYFQPIVKLDTGDVTAMEALVRWEHPVHGLLTPLHFIPIAEETGLIVQIGRIVLRTACEEAVAWNLHRPDDRRVKVSVNLSQRQFRDPELVDYVAAVLRQTGLPGSGLYLEITESLMMEDEAGARLTLERLREIGVHLAVDDFGTGYSSLGTLRQFPVEVVKIDRVFVSGIESNPQDAVILAGIVDLAHALNLRVVAEGVETAGERDQLRAMGCDMAQGFLYSHPLPARDVVALL